MNRPVYLQTKNLREGTGTVILTEGYFRDDGTPYMDLHFPDYAVIISHAKADISGIVTGGPIWAINGAQVMGSNVLIDMTRGSRMEDGRFDTQRPGLLHKFFRSKRWEKFEARKNTPLWASRFSCMTVSGVVVGHDKGRSYDLGATDHSALYTQSLGGVRYYDADGVHVSDK